MPDDRSKRSAIRLAELKYLSEMLPQLRNMASQLEESLLSKLLDMAALEAKLKLTLEEEYAANSVSSSQMDDIDNIIELSATR